jgi:hypothetical protein
MADDGWDLTGIPPWIWPYIRPTEVSFVSSVLGSALAVQQIGRRLGGEQGKALSEAAASTIADWEDEFCGTPPRPHRVFGAAEELARVAATLPEGSELAASLKQVAGSLVTKSLQTRG